MGAVAGVGRMRASGGVRGTLRALRRAAWVAPLALVLSCADMPTAPRPLVAVSGQILDRDGGPVTSARVWFYAADSLPGFQDYATFVITDAAGRFSLSLPSAPFGVSLEPSSESGYPFVRLPVWTPRPGASTLDYRYSGFRVQGNITGPDGQPVSDSYAYIAPVRGLGTASSHAFGGHYSLLVPSGTYYMDVGPSHYYGNVGLPTKTFATLDVTADTTIDVSLSGAKIDLTITLAGTLPLSGAYVVASAPDLRAAAATDISGTVTLYLPPALYSIDIDPDTPGVVDPEVFYRTIQADQPLSIDIPSVRWTGVFRRLADGSPIVHAWMEVEESGPYSLHRASLQTGASGEFQFYVRPGIPYDFRAVIPAGPVISSQLLVPARSVASIADSTFDLYVDVPTP